VITRSAPRNRSFSLRLLVAFALLGLVAAIGPIGALPAGGSSRSPQQPSPQPSPAPPALQVTFVSPSVPPTGTFELRFAPTTSVPPDSTMVVRIHRRLSGGEDLRAEVARVANGGSAGSVLEGPIELPAALLGNPAAGWNIPLQITNSSTGSGDRLVVPDDGIHPVSLDLQDAAGTSVWERTVFMVRPPETAPVGRDGRPAQSSVTLALGLDGPPSLAPDGGSVIDDELLSTLDDVAGLLEAVPEAPLSLAISPNLLTGAGRSETLTAEALTAALQRPGLRARSIRRTDVPVDVGGIITANGLDVLQDELTIGSQVVEAETLRRPVEHTWLLDDTLTPEALPAITALGTTRVVLPVDRLVLPDDTDERTARSRTMVLSGGQPTTSDEAPPVPLTVVADDPLLGLLSLEPDLDPGVVANLVAAELSADWFDAVDDDPDSFPGPQTVLFVPPRIDPSVLLSLIPALTGAGPLTADPEAIPPPAGPVDGEYLVAGLAPRTVVDQAGPVTEYRSSRTRIIGVRSVVGPVEPMVRTWDLVNTQSLARTLDPAVRAASHATIDVESSELLGRIEAPPERKVVLTSRDATIPLRFRNGLPYPVDVGLRVRSSRLELPDGERQTVRLVPGENLVELRVTVRAPGESVVRVDVTSPDDSVGIDSVRIPVQASTISGVGAALSIASLAVLAWWWLVTVRRRRRHTVRDDGRHPSAASDPGDGSGTGPTEGAPTPPSIVDGSVADGG
jgi:hypothetical protein